MTKWIPKPTGGKHYVGWHMKDHHGVDSSPNGRGPKAMEEAHDKLHAEGVFKEGVEHKHWEPKTPQQLHLENQARGSQATD